MFRLPHSVIEKSSPLFKLFDLVADAINPLLALGVLALLIIGMRKRQLSARAWLAFFLGIAVVYVVKTIDGKLDLWESFGGDYSTHSALCVALLIPLGFLRPRLTPLWAGVLVFYAALMMVLGFHTLLDIGSTLLVVAPLIFLIHFLLLRNAAPAVAEAPQEV